MRREFTSHVSLDCWFADGDAVEAQWVWVKIYYRTNAEHMKKKKKRGDEVFSALFVNGAVDSKIL